MNKYKKAVYKASRKFYFILTKKSFSLSFMDGHSLNLDKVGISLPLGVTRQKVLTTSKLNSPVQRAVLLAISPQPALSSSVFFCLVKEKTCLPLGP